ncbi:MAG: FkbM family methyltransferase [Pyrinomonadaceae bacterium]
MKQALGWNWPDRERHLLEWMVNPKARMGLNGRLAYQGKKQQTAIDLVPKDKRRRAIDVGAHVGLWSWNLSFWFKDVESFEPVPEHRECWQANLGARENLVLHPYALGDHVDMVAIHTDASSTGDSRISGRGDVEMKMLDSFGFTEVDFIKIDCEGYEEFVLKGGVETIKEWKPVIVVEQKRDMALRFDLKTLGAVTFLRKLGYETVKEISGDYFMRYTG